MITDLKMEGVDGMQILQTVNKLYPDTKVIMITAYATLDIAIEALRKRVFDFFPKTYKNQRAKKKSERSNW